MPGFVQSEITRLRRPEREARLRAIGDNLYYDQRLRGARYDQWAREVESESDDDPDVDDLAAAHRRQFYASVTQLDRGRAAPAFTAANQNALQRAPDSTVRLVRIEDLNWPLTDQGRTESQILEAFRAARGIPEPADTLSRADGESVLEQFTTAWNQRRDNRAAFGAFHDAVRPELGEARWATGLRDRLGLGHLRPRNGKPLLVALMVIPVADILAPLPPDQQGLAFAAPTAIEGPGFSEWFFPTPRPARPDDVSYGRVVDLRGRGDRLVTEVIHRPVAYRPSHMARIGWIDDELPDIHLWDLRNTHLGLLRRDAPAFAEPMSPDREDAVVGDL